MTPVQHVEFFDPQHFQQYYFRTTPVDSLSGYIDFFWETHFDNLWSQHPLGFSDLLFPNIGYTYLVNLGTPFTMQLGLQKFAVKNDSLLPRHIALECFHQKDNHIFGIKFKISPVLLEKKIDFSEYRSSIYPLCYLVDETLLKAVKQATSFDERVAVCTQHYETLLNKNKNNLKAIEVVKCVLDKASKLSSFKQTIEMHAAAHNVTPRTLHRYFETTTSLPGKKVLQILRIRMAVEQLMSDPAGFECEMFGYHDKSHFTRHLKQFLNVPGFNRTNLLQQFNAMKQV